MMTKMSTLEFHTLASLFPLLGGTDFDELVADIRAYGLREPIVVYEDKVLDGRNRLRACTAAGVEPTFTAYTGDDPVAYVVSLNLRRRHLDESQRAMVAAKLATLKLGDNQHSEGPSIEGASRLLNISHASVERAKAVQRAGTPELIHAVERGGVSVSAAADLSTLPAQDQREIVARGEWEILQAALAIRARKGEQRRVERLQRLVEASKGNADLPIGRKWPILLADPPWQHEHQLFSSTWKDIKDHYPTLTLEQICALPVAEIASENALLFLWVPPPKLAESFKVIEAWGFDYRTGLVWVKHAIGMGNYVRQKHEHLLIARRGDIPMPATADRPVSVLEAPRRKHSQKPDEVYEIIERMYPTLPKIELFARNARENWSAWGNEIAQAAAPKPILPLCGRDQ
jgi:N6-adenosine-specific RNA methylase IME4/ParB-like chromosome segregation protein Spo0J